MVFSLNTNTKRYVSKAFLSPFVDGIAKAQNFGQTVCHTAPL